MIDGMFQTGTDKALDDQIQRPAPFKPDEPGFSLLRVPKRIGQGVGGAAANTIAFGAEITGAFGSVAGAGGFNQGGMFSTPTAKEKQEQDAAAKKLREQGPEFSNEAGDIFRARAKEIMPDPTSTHASEQVIAGISQFATQAIGYAATTGPAAPFLLGGDVGMAEADKLKQQGVPLGARTAAGAVAGAVAGVSIALPIAVPGSVAKTAALVAAGGPGGFIAQNAAERAILNNAGYEKIASQYDPLDPLGLMLSTIVPAGFGAAAVRGARVKSAPTLKEVVLGIESNGQRYAKDGSVLTSPKGAKGEMQVMDNTNLDPGFGVRPAADSSLAERARVGSDYLDAMLKRYGSEDKAMAAYNAGPGALDKALARAAKEGGDYLRFLPAETQAYVTKGMKKLGEERTNAGAREAIARDPDLVAAARVRQTLNAIDSYRLTSDSDLAGMTRHQDAMESAHAQLARGEPVQVADIVRVTDAPALPNLRIGDAAEFSLRNGEQITIEMKVDERGGMRNPDAPASANEIVPSSLIARDSAGKEIGSLDFTPGGTSLHSVVDAAHRRKGIGTLLYDLMEAAGSKVPPALETTSNDALALRAYRDSRPPSAQTRVAATASAVRTLQDAMPVRAAPATGRQLFDAAGESTLPASTAPAKSGDYSAALDKQAAEVAELNPDLMVQLEGMDKPMRAADLLEQVKKEAADETRDASLVDVAANCFLRTG